MTSAKKGGKEEKILRAFFSPISGNRKVGRKREGGREENDSDGKCVGFLLGEEVAA